MKNIVLLLVILLGCQADRPRKPASECFPSWDTMISFTRHNSFNGSLFKANSLITKLNDCFDQDVSRLSEKQLILTIKKCYPYLPKSSRKKLEQTLQRAKWMINGHFDVRMVQESPHINLYFKDHKKGINQRCSLLNDGLYNFDPERLCLNNHCNEENYFKNQHLQPTGKIDTKALFFSLTGDGLAYRLQISGELNDIVNHFGNGQNKTTLKNRIFKDLRDKKSVDIIELLPHIPRESLYKSDNEQRINDHNSVRHFYKDEHPTKWEGLLNHDIDQNQIHILSGLIKRSYCLIPGTKAQFGDIFISYGQNRSARYLIDGYVYTKEEETPWVIKKVQEVFGRKYHRSADIYRRCK